MPLQGQDPDQTGPLNLWIIKVILLEIHGIFPERAAYKECQNALLVAC